MNWQCNVDSVQFDFNSNPQKSQNEMNIKIMLTERTKV